MQWAQKNKGFTIVELLIVVVVIAILAAITIVAYNGIQNRAKQSAAQSTASQASKKLASYAVVNGDTYPSDITASDINLTNSGDTRYDYWRSVDGRSYCLTATKSNASYFVSNTNATPQSGACDGHAANGEEVITNQVLNPSLETNLNGVSYMGAANTSSTPNHTTDWASNGTRSLRITKNGTAYSPQGVKVSLPVALNEGDIVRWAATVYNSSTSSSARTFSAYGERGSPSYTGYNPNSNTTINPGSSGRITGQMTITASNSAAAGTSGFGVLPLSTFAVNESYLIDGFIITVNQPLPTSYVDGSVAGWAWKGTPNASASTGPFR